MSCIETVSSLIDLQHHLKNFLVLCLVRDECCKAFSNLSAFLSSLRAGSEEGLSHLRHRFGDSLLSPGPADYQAAERKCRPVLMALQEAVLNIGQTQLLLQKLCEQAQQDCR